MIIRLLIAVLSLLALGFISSDEQITVYLIGDSTMAEKLEEKRPETGWGEKFQKFFDDGVVIKNHARNGRSTRTFLSENRWQPIVDSLKSGDYVFIQFGHNDQSKEKPDRYTPPEEFRKNLVKFVTDTRSKNAHPVLLTPIMRRRFDSEGRFYDVHGEYPDLVRAVAKEQNVLMIDLHRMSEKVIKEHGTDGSKKLFLWLAPGESSNYPNGIQDNTHFSPLGAEMWAKLVAEKVRDLGVSLFKMKNEQVRQ